VQAHIVCAAPRERGLCEPFGMQRPIPHSDAPLMHFFAFPLKDLPKTINRYLTTLARVVLVGE
jgi:hypothetical protein